MTGPSHDGALTGLGRLVRLVLRRDRVRLTVWVVAIAGLSVVSAASLKPLYPDRASLEQYVRLASGNPALKAFAGPGSGFDDPNLGVILVNEVQLWAGIAMAFMAIFSMTRHTRTEEDAERADVIRSGVVGHDAPLAAAASVVSVAIVGVAAACAVGFIALGYAAVGSVALGASLAAMGLVFVGVTAVAAQVASSARASIGYATAVLGAMFMIRAVGDAGREWARWLSPLGWAQSGRAFAGERWWPLVLCLVLSGALLLLAHRLADRRDLGSGLIATHAGPARASRLLVHPVGLALRLQRGALIGWAIAMVVFGALYGSIGDQIGEFVADNPVYADIVAQLEGADLTDSFLATSVAMLTLIASGFSISAVMRLRTEEHAGRADPVLATPLSRNRWAASYLLVDLVGTIVIVVAGGLGTGVAYAAVVGDASQVPRLVGAALVTLPAALVMMGVAFALFGLVPRAALAAWAVLSGVATIVFFGELLRLPHWVRDLSPFTHVPAVPAESVRWEPILALLVVAAVLVATGLLGLRRRDIAGG